MNDFELTVSDLYVGFRVNKDVSVIKNYLTGIVFKTKQNLMGKVMKG